MPSHRDPRGYVKQVPLPIGPQKGLKIQARGDSIYNPTLPSRDDVRKDNYTRRILQLTQQGFRSVSHKPYQGIGDPFYLDQKKLILHALGQWDESQSMESSSSSESSDDETPLDSQNVRRKHMTPANFVLRRTRKDLNTLPKELASGRDMIRNVRLGHGLFQLLRKERQMKSDAKQRELREKQEQRRNEWQPPKYDSSSDDTDEELMEEVDLRNFMVSLTPAREQTEQEPSESRPDPLQLATTRSVAFQDVDSERQYSASVQPSARSGRSSTQNSRSRKRMPAPRPYTPQHCNISADYNAQPDKESLFRQLCALYWILEAMNIEPPKVMAPITLSWNLKEIGGSKFSGDKVTSDKQHETRWRQFVSAQTPKPDDKKSSYYRKALTPFGLLVPLPASSNRRQANPEQLSPPLSQHPGGKRYSTTGNRLSLTRSGRRSSSHPRGSVSSLAGHSLSGSQSQLSYNQGHGRHDQAIPEGSVLSTLDSSGPLTVHEEAEEAEEVDTDHPLDNTHTHSTVMHSQIVEEQASVVDESSGNPSDHPSTPSSAIKKRRDKKFPETAYEVATPRRQSAPQAKVTESDYEYMKQQIIEKINKSEEDPRMHKLSNPAEKRSGLEYRAEYNIRPKSTPAVLQYQSQLPSYTKSEKLVNFRQQFSEVSEVKALQLHDVLEAVERERMRKIQYKFSNMPTKGSLHRAIDEMRSKSVTDDDSKDKRRRSSIHQQWYVDLYNAVPDDMKEDWNVGRILDRLAKYGLVEASKQSAYKFLNVLDGLRDWEVCSPDIVAAVEFCREKIIEMSVEEYEEWFQQRFPSVDRPRTAPPVIKTNGREEKGNGRAVKSAHAAQGHR